MDCPSHICEYFAQRQDNLRVCWDGHLKQFGIVKLHPSREVGQGSNLCVSGYIHRPNRGPIYSKTGRPGHQDWNSDLVPVVKFLASPEEFLPGDRYKSLRYESEEEKTIRERRESELQDKHYSDRIKEEANRYAIEADRYARANGMKDHTSTAAERIAIQKNAEESLASHHGMDQFTQVKRGFVNE